jgi:hypothetical protein
MVTVESRNLHFGIFDLWSNRPFEKDFELSKKCIARGDFCEIRICTDKRSNDVRTVKMYRKCEVDE